MGFGRIIYKVFDGIVSVLMKVGGRTSWDFYNSCSTVKGNPRQFHTSGSKKTTTTN
jgi:hypothetical protein